MSAPNARRGASRRRSIAAPARPRPLRQSALAIGRASAVAPAGPVGTVLHSALLVAAAQGRNVVLDPGDCRALLADLAELKRFRIAGRQSTTPDAQPGKGGGR